MKKVIISTCGGTSCKSLQGDALYQELKKVIKEKNLTYKLTLSGCHGFCEAGPIVSIKILENNTVAQKIFYTRVPVKSATEIIESLQNNQVIDSLLFEENKKTKEINKDNIDFYKYQTRYLLHRCGEIDPFSIEDYLNLQGYQGLKKIIKMTPEEGLNIIKESGLRGRGGAGFPTFTKWDFLIKAKDDQKYLVANADEGDPGSFMDRSLMEADPFAIIEGMTIASYITKADKGFIYVRAEYPESVKILNNAIKLAEKNNLLGKDILGIKGFNFQLQLFLGAGAFICGEETALMNSIEGKRGQPRPKPPFPAQSGLWGKPTNINNIKTYAYVSNIAHQGAKSFNKYGTEKSKGTAVFCLTGKINHTGIVEVPMGTTLKDLIYKIGGGIKKGKKLKAVLTGGPSGGAIPAEMIDLTADYEALTKAGSIMGSGGIMVLDEEDCMVETAKFFLGFTTDESCGKCVPCREGTKRMHEILEKICEGKGSLNELEKLEKLANTIKDTALCGLGQTAPNPVLTTIKYFKDEYLKHIVDKKCPAGKCEKLLSYFITDKCVGCGLCKRRCPVLAISGEPKGKHSINQSKCTKCGECFRVCPFKAITKT